MPIQKNVKSQGLWEAGNVLLNPMGNCGLSHWGRVSMESLGGNGIRDPHQTPRQKICIL